MPSHKYADKKDPIKAKHELRNMITQKVKEETLIKANRRARKKALEDSGLARAITYPKTMDEIEEEFLKAEDEPEPKYFKEVEDLVKDAIPQLSEEPVNTDIPEAIQELDVDNMSLAELRAYVKKKGE